MNPLVKSFEMLNVDVAENFLSNRESSRWIYEELSRYGYKMMHIMGDTDGILSLAGAWGWIRKFTFPVTKPWTPWISKDTDQLVGFIKQYGTFTLATVHGYGHDAINRVIDEVP